MAEPFSIAASALQVAGAGLSLAKTLHAYIETVKSAAKHIKAVAVEVKLTASVLEHLGALLKENEAEKLCTSNVLSDAQEALSGCKDAFSEMEEAFKGVVKSLPNGARSVSTTARFAWPFKKGKVETLQANLERLKSTLLLMLSVLSYARERTTRPANVLSLQRVQIQNLIKAKDDATTRYEEMLVDLQRLKSNDDHVNPSQLRATQDDLSLWIPMSAATVYSSAAPASDAQNPTALLKQLGVCASTVSSLAASVSTAMTRYSTDGELEAPTIRQSFDHVTRAVTSLLASGSQHGFGDPTLDLANLPSTPGGTKADKDGPSGMHALTQQSKDEFERPFGQQLQRQQSEESGNQCVRDYQYQLMILERQNKKRLLMARQEQAASSSERSEAKDSSQRAQAQTQAVTQPQPVSRLKSPGSEQAHTTVFKGELDQVITVAEHSEPEYEPRADAVRAGASIVRSMSRTRPQLHSSQNIGEGRRTAHNGPSPRPAFRKLRHALSFRPSDGRDAQMDHESPQEIPSRDYDEYKQQSGRQQAGRAPDIYDAPLGSSDGNKSSSMSLGFTLEGGDVFGQLRLRFVSQH